MYANAPPEVVAMKSMLEASTTWVALSASIHYPSVSLGDSTSADAPPLAVIEPVASNPRTLAPGVVVPGGTVQVLIYMADSSGSAIEKTARAVADELSMMPAGLPITEISVGMCSEPNAGARAAQEYATENSLTQYDALRVIPIIVSYGLS